MSPAIDTAHEGKHQHHAALQTLAEHYARPMQEITELYEAQLNHLSEHASIKHYLVMLAIKHVDDQLRAAKHRH
jgi:hypothetical protein